MLLALLAMRKFLDLGLRFSVKLQPQKKKGVWLYGAVHPLLTILRIASPFCFHTVVIFILLIEFDRIWFTDVRSTSLPESRGRSHEVQKPIIPDHPWISRTPSLETRSSATIFLGHSTSACARCQKGKVLGISFSRQLNSFCVHNDI
jgi:hypothetical protein